VSGMVTSAEIAATVVRAGLKNKALILHSSYKSFGGVKEGPKGVLDAFLDEGCTVMAPTFSWRYMVPPPCDMRPPQNGFDYTKMDSVMQGASMIYNPESTEIEEAYMGVIPKIMLETTGRVRGSHPICSFCALGPYAPELIRGQKPMDVFAPLRELALFNGYIVLAGVNYTRMTMLHLAEQMTGKRMFIRWANDENKKPAINENGGCSEGFYKLEPYLSNLERAEKAGESRWRILHAGRLLKAAARLFQLKPGIGHCDDPKCIRCNDMEKGGPIITPDLKFET
jgi:aminoglycoside N3'-acetyltransferase